MHWIWWIVIAAGAAFLLFGVLPYFVMAGFLYTVLLVRTKPEKWGRECSMPDDEEIVRMFDEGLAWAERWQAHKTEVRIRNDGFGLCGEYFDFGHDKAVLIVAGRMESLLYSYYFAEPYRAAGCNVLVIDNRAHGLSDGKINSLGFKEYRDLLAWGRLLHEKGNRKIVIHGICIGSSAGLFALTAAGCPDYFAGLVAEGMYANFYESFRNHMIEQHHPNFPFTPLVMMYIRLISGADVVHDGPLKRIGRLDKPLLMLHSREDIYSTPDRAQAVFDACGAEEKRLEWFDRGAHSHIRINNTARYDQCIIDFLSRI